MLRILRIFTRYYFQQKPVGCGLRIAIAYVHSDTQGWQVRAKPPLPARVRASAPEGVGGRPLRLRFAARHPGIAGGIYCRTGVAADAVCNEGRLAEWAAGWRYR